MKKYEPARQATVAELDNIVEFLCVEELGACFSADYEEVAAICKAVHEATIVVFPRMYRDGSHQFWIAWHEEYHHLPNHWEHLKITPTGEIRRVFKTGRHKYRKKPSRGWKQAFSALRKLTRI